MPAFKFNPFSSTFDIVNSSASDLTNGTTGTGAIVLADSPALTSNPTAPTQSPNDNSTKLATTAYVDEASKAQNYKEAAKYATTAALAAVTYSNGASGVGATLTAVAVGAISFDGSTPAVGDRVLVKDQASQFQNGIYLVTVVGSGIAVFVLTRTTDFDQSNEINTGDAALVTSGATLSATTWAYTGIDSPTMGTTALTFVQIAAGVVTDASLSTSDITTNDASTTKHGFLLKATAPASGLRNVVAIDNGETVYKDAALFDATVPAALGTAAAGTAMAAARRDHVHSATIAAIIGTGTTTLQGLVDISGASAGQIKFPATQNASSNVNTLDDYEEGTWTPVLGGGGGTSGQTYLVQTGTYIKIGKLAYVDFSIQLSVKGTITGIVQVQGLPFSVGSGQGVFCSFHSLAVNVVSINGTPSGTIMDMRKMTAIGTSSLGADMATADINNDTQVRGWFCYTASA